MAILAFLATGVIATGVTAAELRIEIKRKRCRIVRRR